MAAELRPGHLLDQFLERADAARQRDEGVGAIEHGAFALMHVARDDLLLREPPRLLLRGQEFRNDAGRRRRRVRSPTAIAPIRPTEPPP